MDRRVSVKEDNMEDVIIKVGLLRSWLTSRGFGFIESPSTTLPLQRYFLHINDIEHGPNPPLVGSLIRFEVAPPRKTGECPGAKKAWIIDPKDVSKEAV